MVREGTTGPDRVERRREGSRNWQENLIGSGTNQESYFIKEKRTRMLLVKNKSRGKVNIVERGGI